jgi:acetyl/propionyl-CoA carboxylase alpha subunit
VPVTFEIEIAGRVHVVSVEPVDVPSPRGGRFRLEVRPAGDTAPADAFEVDASRTELGLSIVSARDGRVCDAAVTDRGGGLCLVQLPHVDLDAVIDGRRRHDDPHRESAGDGEVRVSAPMPGRVLRLLVQPGDVVAVRQPLVVVEAMKMENELTAPRAGRVREVGVTEGASVEAGRVLVVLD